MLCILCILKKKVFQTFEFGQVMVIILLKSCQNILKKKTLAGPLLGNFFSDLNTNWYPHVLGIKIFNLRAYIDNLDQLLKIIFLGPKLESFPQTDHMT